VIYKRKRVHSKVAGGFFHFEELKSRTHLHGYGHGDYVRLRDEFGNIWKGSAETMNDESVRYTFRDANGHTITGLSDSDCSGIILRDSRGKSWRGFLD
jgi:hypothetical protein